MVSRNKVFAIIFTIGALIASFSPFLNAAKEEIVPYPDAMTGKIAPPFSLQGLYGEKFNLTDLKGSPTVLIFGTSW